MFQFQIVMIFFSRTILARHRYQNWVDGDRRGLVCVVADRMEFKTKLSQTLKSCGFFLKGSETNTFNTEDRQDAQEKNNNLYFITPMRKKKQR